MYFCCHFGERRAQSMAGREQENDVSPFLAQVIQYAWEKGEGGIHPDWSWCVPILGEGILALRPELATLGVGEGRKAVQWGWRSNPQGLHYPREPKTVKHVVFPCLGPEWARVRLNVSSCEALAAATWIVDVRGGHLVRMVARVIPGVDQWGVRGCGIQEVEQGFLAAAIQMPLKWFLVRGPGSPEAYVALGIPPIPVAKCLQE